MAPKNSSRLLDNPPSPSPDLEEQEESSSEEEEEQVQTPQKTPTKTHPQQKPKSPSSSEEEEEEEEGSGSDDDDGTKSSPTASDFTIKPVATKNTTKNNSKESTKPSSKRSLEPQKDDEKKGPIKKKSKLGAENGEEAKRVAVNSSGGSGIMARVFSEDDEIALLKGMIDYQSQKGADPGENLMDFLEFVKGKFQFEVTKSQLYEKIRRLKKKFLNNVKKGENGQDPVISRPHEYSCFELSKKIWGKPIANGGDENFKINGGKVKKSGKVKSLEGKMKEDGKKEEEEEEVGEDDDNMIVEKEVVKDNVVAVHDMDFSSKYRYLSESYDVRDMHMSETLRTFKKENISLIDEEKAKELDEKWKKLRLQEIELFSKRSRLMIEQAKLVMDAMKKR